MGRRIVGKPKATACPAAFRYLPAISKGIILPGRERCPNCCRRKPGGIALALDVRPFAKQLLTC